MKIVFNNETQTFSILNLFRGNQYDIVSNILAFLENSDNYDEKFDGYEYGSIEDIIQDNIDDNLIPIHPNDNWHNKVSDLNECLHDSDKKLLNDIINKLNSYFNDHKSYLLNKSLIDTQDGIKIYKIKSGYYIESRKFRYMLIPLDKLISDINKDNKFNIPKDTIFKDLRNDDYILTELQNKSKKVSNKETKVSRLIDGIKSAWNTSKLMLSDIIYNSVTITENILNSFLYDPEIYKVHNNLNDSSDIRELWNFLDKWNGNNSDKLILLHNTKDAVIKSAKLFYGYKQLNSDEKKCIEIVSDLYDKISRNVYNSINSSELKYVDTLRVTDKYKLELYRKDDCLVLMKVNRGNRMPTNNIYMLFSQLMRRILLMNPKFPEIDPDVFSPDKFLS